MEKGPKIKKDYQAELTKLHSKVSQFAKLQTERKKAMQALQESESRFRDIFENANDGIILHDTEGHIFDVNQAMYKRLGYTKQEMIKMNLKELVTPEFGEKIKARMDQLETEGVAIFESADRRKDGTAMPVEVNARYVEHKGQKIIQSVVRDITDRRLAEDLIVATLREKDLIFGEIQHRSAFITEVFSKTLNFLREISDVDSLKKGLEAAKNRCKSITRIQHKLYQSPSFARIDMAETIKNLSQYTYALYQDGTKNVRIRREIKNIYMDLHRAFYCALLINEFLSNSLRHAFPDNTTGEIEIKLRGSDHGFILTYRDNGVGVKGSIPLKKSKTLGMQLITELVDRLDGKMDMDTQSGTEFVVTFRS